MASNSDYVREELKRLGYNYRDQATKDIMSALVNFKDLKPKSDLFVSNTGERKHRLSLDGTIPVIYRGTTYNIPVRIWIRQDHPYSPPIPFVKPTETMRIKVSRHVDQAGMIYMPYLHDWSANQSDLGGLIQVMRIIFGEQPPVYASAQPPPPVYARSAQPPPPQQPPRMPTPTPNPGYPSSYGQPTPYPPASGGGYPKQQYHRPPPPPQTASPYPRLPHPQPPAGDMPMPYPPPSAASQQPPYPGRSAAPYPTPTPHSQPPRPQPPYPPSLPKPAPPVVTNPIPASSPVAVATTQGSFDTSASSVGAAPLADRQDSFELSADQQRDSLKSAVEDKLRRQLKEIWERAENEMQSLHKTKEELEQGSRKLNGMLETLDQKQKEVEENICTMTNQDEKIRDALSKLELSVKEMNVEKIVVPAQPLYDQIFRLYAEENAIEDTIFYLTEGLRKGVVDVDVYLKHVRSLSRSQFEKRALMQKARKRAGLGEL
ncbi:tumor susceptibility gene 101 protein-like [Oscarella lobularis]|uniref:tumor susceptibility gene 101 protein-like n=1 Tax=Oscarella lobularis TaxID=121494 RepID=UPI003313F552